jgi:hypothetical protein
MDFFDIIKRAFTGDGGDSNLSFFDFLAGDEFSDVPDLWGSGDFDFSKLTSAFNDADIEAFANLGSGSYNSMDEAIIDYAEKSGQDLATAQQKFAASGLKLDDLPGVSKFSTIKNAMKSFGLTDEAGKMNPAALLGLTGLLSFAGQGSRGAPPPSGYQGTVPKYTAVRERVPIPQDPNRRPGAGGRRYFSDVSYVAPGTTPAETQTAVDTARTAAKAQAEALKPALYPTPQVKASEQEKTTEVIKPSLASGVAQLLPVPKYNTKGNVIVPGDQPVMPPANELSELDATFSSLPVSKLIEMFSSPPSARPDPIPPPTLPPKVEPTATETPENFSLVPEVTRTAPRSISGADMLNIPIPAARGGLMELAKGRYLNGSTDGMEDKIPATISGKQPARLSHGEFVVPADVVSHLGNGNSNAGAQRLYDMMDRVRKARTGNPKQGKQINPNKYLPK